MMKKLVLPTAVLGLALIVAACGGAPVATSEQAATSAPVAATIAKPTAAPAPATEVVEQPAAATAEDATAEDATAEPAIGDSDMAKAPVVVANTKLNLNEATGDDYLAAIPGFSSRMVREFLEYRPYVSIQQFRREIGKYVGDDVVAGYEQYVYVPVDVNESDAETLQQLPGVDDAIAAELIAARPYDSSEAFLAALTQLVAADDLAAAPGYLQAQ